jgi:hypothetical protein
MTKLRRGYRLKLLLNKRKENELMGGWLIFASIMYAAGTIGKIFM